MCVVMTMITVAPHAQKPPMISGANQFVGSVSDGAL
jgi:hypothetical protein